MASFPPRLKGLIRRCHELIPQVDLLRVYGNNYTEIPAELRGYAEAGVLDFVCAGLRPYRDLGSQGKLWWLDEDRDSHYLMVDDDIYYPKDYVSASVIGNDRYKGRAFTSFHGGIFRIHNNRGELPCDRPAKAVRNLRPYDVSLPLDKAVHMTGNGCSCCRPSIIGLTRAVIQGPLHSGDDEDIAVWAQKRNVPCIVIAHASKWLKPDNEVWPVQALHTSKPCQDLSDAKLKLCKCWELKA